MKFHSIREAEKNLLIKLHYCLTDVQLADIITKTFSKSRLEFLRMKLGLSRQVSRRSVRIIYKILPLTKKKN